MKRITLAIGAALSLAQVSTSFAEEDPVIDWVGAYGIYYDIDEDKPIQPISYLDDSLGGGLEIGFRFSPQWAARIEAAYMEAYHNETPFGEDQYGMLYGIDAMYFLEDDLAYIFGGVKVLDLAQNYNMLNVGIGKHWSFTENLKLITEVAGYFDPDDDLMDASLKLGIAYTFGSGSKSTSSKPAAAPAPIDSDKDGVIDSNDLCPNTPMGSKVDNNGCLLIVKKDSDSDGVVDSADKCPNTPTTDSVDADGCTRFGEKVLTQTVKVLFANNSADITNPNAADIEEFVAFMKRYGKVEAVIEGHASAPGNDDYNMKLSQRRADAFKNLLIEQYGISASRLSSMGYGETRLLDKSNTAAAHRKNRRIDVNASETIKVKITK